MQFVEVFRSHATNTTSACKAFGISRPTFYTWLKEDEAFAKAIEAEHEAIKDFGESQLLTLMKGIPKLDEAGRIIGWVSRPDTACIIFFNKTKNKDRGYDERNIIKREGDWLDGVTIQVSSVEQAQQLKDFLNSDDDGDATKTE